MSDENPETSRGIEAKSSGTLVLCGTFTVSVGSLMWTVLLVLLLPMALGCVTRRILLRAGGARGYEESKPFLSTVTMIGMLLVGEVIFFTRAQLFTDKGRLLIPLATVMFLYLVIIFALMTLNLLAAIPVATLPIFQIVCSIGYVQLGGQVKRFFPQLRVPSREEHDA